MGARQRQRPPQRRPAEAEDRAATGHWEGDLIIGLNRSAIGTLVERTTRFTMLVHLPREEGYGQSPPVKNRPALSGYGAESMSRALARKITDLPEHLLRSLTRDRGKELSAHAQFTIDTGLPVFFADPRRPWQRGSNKNTNGLLRQYFPRAPTYPAGPHRTSPPSRTPSTRGHERPSGGELPPKLWTSIDSHYKRQMLRRPIESALTACVRGADQRFRLEDQDLVASVGSRGDSYDNALAEALKSLFKAELVRNRHKGPWRDIDDLEIAVAEYIDWFNHRRIHGEIGYVPPAEYEAQHAAVEPSPQIIDDLVDTR